MELYITDTALKVSRSSYCFTTSISRGDNYFPRLWGTGISDAIVSECDVLVFFAAQPIIDLSREENIALVTALRNTFLPRLFDRDANLFATVVGDLFPDVPVPLHFEGLGAPKVIFHIYILPYSGTAEKGKPNYVYNYKKLEQQDLLLESETIICHI